MIGIVDKDDNLLTPFVSLMTSKEPLKIVNRLLDGSYHVQVLGFSEVALLDIYANQIAKARLEAADANGEQLRVVIHDKSWQGKVLSLGTWKRISQEYYQTTAKLALDSSER